MTDAPQNFVMHAGDSKRLKITLVDEADIPVPLAGVQTIEWKLGRTVRSVSALNKSLTNGGVVLITDQAGTGQVNCGRFDVLVNNADSINLDGEYVHICTVKDASGATQTVFHGRVNVERII